MTIKMHKVWFDGDNLVTQEIPEDNIYKREPVAWYHAEEYKTNFTTEPAHDLIGKYWQPLYTAPRPWVGLTDGELRDIAGEGPDYFDWKVFGRAIEAKLRERNT